VQTLPFAIGSSGLCRIAALTCLQVIMLQNIMISLHCLAVLLNSQANVHMVHVLLRKLTSEYNAAKNQQPMHHIPVQITYIRHFLAALFATYNTKCTILKLEHFCTTHLLLLLLFESIKLNISKKCKQH